MINLRIGCLNYRITSYYRRVFVIKVVKSPFYRHFYVLWAVEQGVIGSRHFTLILHRIYVIYDVYITSVGVFITSILDLKSFLRHFWSEILIHVIPCINIFRDYCFVVYQRGHFLTRGSYYILTKIYQVNYATNIIIFWCNKADRIKPWSDVEQPHQFLSKLPYYLIYSIHLKVPIKCT